MMYNSIVGIVYDENGNYLVDIGTPEGNFAVNQTENLFEFDFNLDGKKVEKQLAKAAP